MVGQCFCNLDDVLGAAGASMRGVVALVTCGVIVGIDEGCAEVEAKWLPSDPPVGTAVVVAALLVPGASLEIEPTASGAMRILSTTVPSSCDQLILAPSVSNVHVRAAGGGMSLVGEQAAEAFVTVATSKRAAALPRRGARSCGSTRSSRLVADLTLS